MTGSQVRPVTHMHTLISVFVANVDVLTVVTSCTDFYMLLCFVVLATVYMECGSFQNQKEI